MNDYSRLLEMSSFRCFRVPEPEPWLCGSWVLEMVFWANQPSWVWCEWIGPNREQSDDLMSSGVPYSVHNYPYSLTGPAALSFHNLLGNSNVHIKRCGAYWAMGCWTTVASCMNVFHHIDNKYSSYVSSWFYWSSTVALRRTEEHYICISNPQNVVKCMNINHFCKYKG